MSRPETKRRWRPPHAFPPAVGPSPDTEATGSIPVSPTRRHPSLSFFGPAGGGAEMRMLRVVAHPTTGDLLGDACHRPARRTGTDGCTAAPPPRRRSPWSPLGLRGHRDDDDAGSCRVGRQRPVDVVSAAVATTAHPAGRASPVPGVRVTERALQAAFLERHPAGADRGGTRAVSAAAGTLQRASAPPAPASTKPAYCGLRLYRYRSPSCSSPRVGALTCPAQLTVECGRRSSVRRHRLSPR